MSSKLCTPCFVYICNVTKRWIQWISHERSGSLPKRLRNQIMKFPYGTRQHLARLKVKDQASLFRACYYDNVEIVKFLVEDCGASLDVEERITNDDVWRGNFTLLCWACRYGTLPLVKYLVQQGCDVNAPSECGSTPLLISSHYHNLIVIQYLVANGADIHKPNYVGTTCLMKAASEMSVCQFLISKGADVNAHDVKNRTALMHAIEQNDSDTFLLLLDSGADPYITDIDGNDALQLTCIKGEAGMMKYLLNRYSYSSQRRANAFELIGSQIINIGVDELISDDNEDMDPYHFWQMACQIRSINKVQKLPKLPPRYGRIVEFSSLAELSIVLAADEAEEQMQALLIQERILGVDSMYTAICRTRRANYFKGIEDYSKCFGLWLTALSTNVRGQYILFASNCDAAWSMVKLMLHLKKNGDMSDDQLFGYASTLFIKLATKILAAHASLSIRPICENHVEQFQTAVLCLVHVIYLLIVTVKSERHRTIIKHYVSLLHRRNIRWKNGITLLHLAVLRQELEEESNLAKLEYSLGIFPNADVARFLIECGLFVDVEDDCGSTPLLYACLPMHYDPEVVRTLLSLHAHTNLTNGFELEPRALLAANPANDIPRAKLFTSLKCRCAQAIVEFRLPYQNTLPEILENFIKLHDTPPRLRKLLPTEE